MTTHNERPLQIRNALPGEVVSARILKKRKGIRYADGYLDGKAHRHRVASVCHAFPRCGGCNLHHLAYAEQLKLKEQQLRDALTANQVHAERFNEPVSVTRSGYRTKARLGVRKLGEQVLVGFRESFSSRVAKLPECLTLTPRLSHLLLPLRELIARLSVADRVPQVELAQGDDGVSLILRHLNPLSTSDIALLQRFEKRERVQVVLQSGGYDTLCSLGGGSPGDRNYLLPRYGLTMHFQPHQFTQVNMAMNMQLIDTVTAYLGPTRDLRVVDLFCGIGNFTLPLARAGATVVGVEASDEAVRKARFNAQVNRVDAEFDVADLYAADSLDSLLIRIGKADAMVLDPPRSGAGPQLPGWLEAFEGRQIVYVSCNPRTFAEDAVALQNAGFVLQEVGVFDMFPHTAHIETLGRFVRP